MAESIRQVDYFYVKCANKAGEAAKRVILRVRAGSKAPLQLVPGFVLHERDGRYTQQVDAILREGAALVLGKSRR